MKPTLAFEQRRDDGYRALGRYVAEFSELMNTMESAIAGCLAGFGVPPGIASVPAAGLMADGFVNVFFGMAQKVHSHSDKELRIAKNLRGKVRKEIQFRNDVAHGLWLIGGTKVENNLRLPMPPTALRTKPGRDAGDFVTIKDDLDERSERVNVLGAYLGMYSRACFRDESGKIRDYLRLSGEKKDKRLIPGPKAPPGHPAY